MLTLDGASQYAYWDGLAAPRNGLVNRDELGGVLGFPLWVTFDFRPAVLPGGSWWTFAFEQRGGGNRFAGQLAGGTIQYNDGVAGRSPHAGVQAGVWQRVLIYRYTRASSITYLDGSAAVEDVADSPWPDGIDTFIVGGRWENGGAPDLLFSGSFANFAIGCATIPPAQRTANIVGVNPLSLPGCIRYWPFKDDAVGALGAWNLTLVGAPTITAVGHPDVAVWPPVGGGGKAGAYSIGSPRVRSIPC